MQLPTKYFACQQPCKGALAAAGLSPAEGQMAQPSQPQLVSCQVSCTGLLSISPAGRARLLAPTAGRKIILAIKKQQQEHKHATAACRTSAPLCLPCARPGFISSVSPRWEAAAQAPLSLPQGLTPPARHFKLPWPCPGGRLSFCMTPEEPWVRLRFKQLAFR